MYLWHKNNNFKSWYAYIASLVAQMVKNLPAVWQTWNQSWSWEDPLEKRMTTHPSILAWRIPWTEKPGVLRVGQDWATNTHIQTHTHTHTHRPVLGLPWWFSGKESLCQHRRCRFDPWSGRIPCRRKWQATPVFLLGNPMDREA